MKRFFLAAFVVWLVVNGMPIVRADDPQVSAVLDKAIKALGGHDKLAKVKGLQLKTKGTLTLNGTANDISNDTTIAGIDQRRSEFDGMFNGNRIQAIVVVNKDQGWRKLNDEMTADLDVDGLADEKRATYTQVVSMTVVPLKGKDFKVELAGEEKLGDKAAVALKVMGPNGKDFKIWFDKESGLPVQVRTQMTGFQGRQFIQETVLSDYQETAGIKRASKIEVKRDGEAFVSQQVTEFKVLETVDPKTFEEPE